MRRFLVVGCGGSGGATLSYLMDQLRSELAPYQRSLPKGWQFVHIDVPIGGVKPPAGLESVVDQGGVYLSTGPQTGGYDTVEATTVASSSLVFGDIATWAPRRPRDVELALTEGAGQFRAVGRMITLSRAPELREELAAAYQRLGAAGVDAEMAQLSGIVPGLGNYQPNQEPLVLVVSSMAGGAGASMALDVCRLLSYVNDNTASLTSMFLYTADVFDKLPANERNGVRANSLAMAGELLAMQSGAAEPVESTAYKHLGLGPIERQTPFARVFPVSSRVGTSRKDFGDRDRETVYRGLARGLAGLISSHDATDNFVTFDLGNGNAAQAGRDEFGWGISNWNAMPWGAFGFASLSTGRDRFGEYAAQRLARAAIDRLYTGHLTVGSPLSVPDQVNDKLDSQWNRYADLMVLPRSADDLEWIAYDVFPNSEDDAASITQTHVRPFVTSPGPGHNGAEIVRMLRTALADCRDYVEPAVSDAAYRAVWLWTDRFTTAIKKAVETASSEYGVTVAIALIDRLQQALTNDVLPSLQAARAEAPADVVALPRDIEKQLGVIQGVAANAGQIVEDLFDGVRPSVREQIVAVGAATAEDVVVGLSNEFLAPLRVALEQAMQDLHLAQDPSRPVRDQGKARLQTDQYRAWPSDRDVRVPDRFVQALNEVLLIQADEFDRRYQEKLIEAAQQDADQPVAGNVGAAALFEEARRSTVTAIVSGIWSTIGEAQPAPANLLEETRLWHSRVLPRSPEGNPVPPQNSTFRLAVQPEDVLARARAFVGRADRPFQVYIRQSLRELFSPQENEAAAEYVARREQLTAAFTSALALACPMISISDRAVRRVHPNNPVAYRYKFSAVPFGGLPVWDDMRAVIQQDSTIDSITLGIFDAAESADADTTHVDIFGSYANYSPIVFDALLSPVATDWGVLQPAGREFFWRWRRARPLRACLPLGDAERRAMIGGWFVGLITGELDIPVPPYRSDTPSARIWDAEDATWVSFPNPLLTPPDRLGEEYNWLPAILESSLIAFAAASLPPIFASLRPYQLLRRIMDDAPLGPTEESTTTRLAAQDRLKEWLRNGRPIAAGRSALDSGALDTREARAHAVKMWLSEVRGFASTHFTEDGKADSRPVKTRRLAMQTPIFRDIAEDVVRETDRLLGFVDKALEDLRLEPDGPVPSPSPTAAAHADAAEDDDDDLEPPRPSVRF